MLELSLRFTSPDDGKDPDSPIQVALLRPDSGASTAQAVFSPPLDDEILDDLRWYLEVFSIWPTGPDYERATQIESQMEDWGRALLESVTQEREAARLWQQFIDAAEREKLITVDATDPRVLRLPWEMLADSGGHLFGREIGVRRRLREETPTTPHRTFDLPVRILVVIARPTDAGFISPRAVSVPLLAALDELGDRVVTEFLYPPTLTALTKRLNNPSAPPVHVVHFDGHGVYDADIGLGFLLFEDEEHKSAQVNANQLGTLLYNCNVPLMVLNACQSAKQEVTNPYASVAARLIRSGVGSVLAMNYSVLVVAARKFVEAFYGGLAGGLTVGKAIDQARRALLADPKRHTLTRRNKEGELVEETVQLFDWFLPALYQQAQDPQVFAQDGGTPPTARILPRALTDENAPGGLPPEPLHGFHGRAYELLKLERELAQRAVVVLHGFGGLGKTALAAEAGRWFTRTGRFPGGAAFISFEFGGSVQQMCSWVGQAVSGDPNWTLGEGDPVQRVADLLSQRPALVILDNFESVLGSNPLMPPDELKAVLDAVWTWAQAGLRAKPVQPGAWGSRILITTRDTTFNNVRFSPSKFCAHIPLGGLAEQDALDLAAQILSDHGIDRARVNREQLVALMDHLGGHPLSLYLVLPQLKRHTPAELIANFEALLPGFTTGEAKARNESLRVSLEFSLRRLGEQTRAALPALAVFQGGCLEVILLDVTEIDPALWATARAELEAAALVRVEPIPGVEPPFLHFHPTLLPYLGGELPAERRAELETRYWQRYYAVANFLYRSDTQHPHAARAIAVRELPNLRRAFDLSLAAALAGEVEAVVPIDFADSIARFLDVFGRWRERDALHHQLDRLPTPDSTAGVTKAEYLRLSGQGNTLLQAGRAAEAERLFRDLLARLETGAAYEADYDLALMHRRLGLCLATQGRPTQAIQEHQRALAGFERLSVSDNDAQKMLGHVYADLGDNLTAIGRFDEAQQAYETCLNIARETEDHREEGVALGQLGNLALERNNLDEAKRRYTEALETFRALDEPQAEGVIWHQLGRVAQETQDWDEAERCYREAVRIREQIRDLPELAKSCNQLAIVAQGAGRLDDAERWFLRAIELGEQAGDRKGLAARLSNLASLYLTLNRLDEARSYAERAAAIKETLDLSAEPWKTYNILAQISTKQGRAEEAAQWRRKERASQDAFAGTRYELARILQNFGPVIAAAVTACNGNAQAKAFVEGEFNAIRQGGAQIEEPIQRIWAGERDPDALTADIDYNSRAIVLAILHRLGVPTLAIIQQAMSAAPDPAQAAHVREQWKDIIQAVIAASQGNEEAAAALAPFLDEMGQRDDWRNLIAVLRRIMAGERDAALLAGLDETDTIVAGDVLRGLGVSLPESEAAPAPSAPPPDQDQAQEGSLDQLIQLVGMAIRPGAPPQLHTMLTGLAAQMSGDPNAPEEARALGRALAAILSGERNPDLSGLPPEVADALRAQLG